MHVRGATRARDCHRVSRPSADLDHWREHQGQRDEVRFQDTGEKPSRVYIACAGSKHPADVCASPLFALAVRSPVRPPVFCHRQGLVEMQSNRRGTHDGVKWTRPYPLPVAIYPMGFDPGRLPPVRKCQPPRPLLRLEAPPRSRVRAVRPVPSLPPRREAARPGRCGRPAGACRRAARRPRAGDRSGTGPEPCFPCPSRGPGTPQARVEWLSEAMWGGVRPSDVSSAARRCVVRLKPACLPGEPGL